MAVRPTEIARTGGEPPDTNPSGGEPSDTSPSGGNPTEPEAPPRAAPAADYTLTPPNDAPKGPSCYDAGSAPLRWTLDVRDAGVKALRFIAIASQEGEPGCSPASKNPRDRVRVGGASTYAPRASGQTTFSYDPSRDFPIEACGRAQVNVSMLDADGHETPLIGVVVDYGRRCEPPSAALNLVCPPYVSSISSASSLYAILTTAGQTPVGAARWSLGGPAGAPLVTYEWSRLDEATRKSAVLLNVPWGASGTSTATIDVDIGTALASRSVSKSCTFTVVFQTLVCAPDTATVAVGQPVTLRAFVPSPSQHYGGDMYWSAPTGVPETGNTPPVFTTLWASSFTTSFSTAGTKSVSVGQGHLASATCTVVVTP
jgi:hypothetical protein